MAPHAARSLRVAADKAMRFAAKAHRADARCRLRASRLARMYEPGQWIERVSPTPLLLVVGRDDKITPTDLALAAFERALEPKKLALIPGGHFELYRGQFAASSAAALAWFTEHLKPAAPSGHRPDQD